MEQERAKYYTNKEIHDNPKLLDSVFDLPNLSDDFTEQLEWSLMYLSFKSSMMGMYENEKAFHFKEFDGAWLIGQDRLGKTDKDNLGFLDPGWAQATPDMFPNLHVKTFNLKTENDTANGLTTYKLIPPQEKRHLPQYRHIMRQRHGMLAKNDKWYLGESYYHLDHNINNFNLIKKHYSESIQEKLTKLCRGKYFPVRISFDPNYIIYEKAFLQHHLEDKEDPQMGLLSLIDLVNKINFAFNIKLSAYYEWFVYIRENDNSIGFKVPINPSASKEIFQLRDIPEGKQRKSAICNFVREHMRTIRRDEMTNDEIQTTVKRHLRGETKFNWRGLQVNVIPSEYDINRVNSKTKKYLSI